MLGMRSSQAKAGEDKPRQICGCDSGSCGWCEHSFNTVRGAHPQGRRVWVCPSAILFACWSLAVAAWVRHAPCSAGQAQPLLKRTRRCLLKRRPHPQAARPPVRPALQPQRPCGPICSRKISSNSGTTTRRRGRNNSSTTGPPSDALAHRTDEEGGQDPTPPPRPHPQLFPSQKAVLQCTWPRLKAECPARPRGAARGGKHG